MKKTKKRRDKKVVLMFQNGCLDLISAPSGVKVILKDYDMDSDEATGTPGKDEMGSYIERELESAD